MTRVRALAFSLLFALLLGGSITGLGYAVAEAGASPPAVLGPGLVTVKVDIRHSRFDLRDLQVRVGTLVEFVVHNRDPINHEFVVGDAKVHALHARGSELTHPPVPGEVSVGPGESGVTTMRFDHVGRIEYACHLPGHRAFGMVGEIRVVGGR